MSQLTSGIVILVFVLTGMVGAAVVLTWAPDRTVAQLTPRWASAPSQFMKHDGLDVHLRDEGPRDDPLPIMLLHGTSASLHTWQPWVNELARSRRIITMDLPGFGLTGPRADADYSIGMYVRFVAGLLDALRVRQVVLGGNSLGGEIAWNVVLSHPDRVKRLILVDSAGFPLNPESIPIGFRIARIPGLNRLMTHLLPRPMVEASVRNVYGDPSRVTPELVDRYFELTLRAGNRAALVSRLRIMRFVDPGPALASLRVPTLIIWGGRDRLIPAEHGRLFAGAIAGSRLVVFDGLGHVPHEEGAAETLAAVRAFISSS